MATFLHWSVNHKLRNPGYDTINTRHRSTLQLTPSNLDSLILFVPKLDGQNTPENMAARSISSAKAMGKTVGLRSEVKKAEQSKASAIRKAQKKQKEAQKKHSATQRAKQVSNANVRRIRRKLRGIMGKLKQYRRQKIGGWVCSRVRHYSRGCITMSAD